MLNIEMNAINTVLDLMSASERSSPNYSENAAESCMGRPHY